MNGTILLIDDNPRILALNRKIFSQRGFRILEADTIRLGRELYIQENPDLILMETVLPDGDGLDFCIEVVKTRRRYIPIVIVSKLETNEDVFKGYDAGCDYYMPKPYTEGKLVAYAEGLLIATKRRENAALERVWRDGLHGG